MNQRLPRRRMRLNVSTLTLVLCALVGPVDAAQESASTNAQDGLKQVKQSLKDATTNMRQAADGLKSTSTNQAIEAQQAAIRSLDQLIKLAKQMPEQLNRATTPPPPGPDSKPPKDGRKRSEGEKNQDTKQRKKDQRPQDSSPGVVGADQSAAAKTERRRVIVREVWGHLPPDLKRRLLSGSKEKPLAKYQRLVDGYFQAIAEKRSSSQSEPTRRASDAKAARSSQK